MINSRWIYRLLWLVLVALLLVGCENGRYSGTLIFDGQHRFGAGDSVPGDVLLRAGTAEFAEGSQVAGTIYVIGGTLLVDGEIGGDLLVLDGRVRLGPTAVIGGDLRFSGGTVDQAETAVIGGQTITGLPLPLDSEPQPAGWDGWLRSLLAALTLAGLGGLWASWRPQPLQHVASATNDQPLVALSIGLLILKVNEHFLDGQGRLELPFGVVENELKVDQGANLALWAESVWLPSLFVTDPRVRWQAVDGNTAVLYVPFGAEEEQFIVRFDPDTGLITRFESMRYKGETAVGKTLWINEAIQWGELDGRIVLLEAALTWYDDGSPWASFEVEELVYNADITDYIRATGP